MTSTDQICFIRPHLAHKTRIPKRKEVILIIRLQDEIKRLNELIKQESHLKNEAYFFILSQGMYDEFRKYKIPDQTV